RVSRLAALNPVIRAAIRSRASAASLSATSRSPMDCRYSETSRLTEVSDCAAYIRAFRYTSSGTDTVMFFIEAHYHLFCETVEPMARRRNREAYSDIMGTVRRTLERLEAAVESGALAEVCRNHSVEVLVLFGSAASYQGFSSS